MFDTDTIIAPATGRGNAALAVIRISGTQSLAIVQKTVLEKERFIKAQPREIHVYTLIDPNNGTAIDEITLIFYLSPLSFTGEKYGRDSLPRGRNCYSKAL